MSYDRPIVLSIAGFDPTGGAGVLTDVKTFEQHQCLGFSVISASTIQSEDEFIAVKWIPLNEIIDQMEPLFSKYSIDFVKIGIIENLEVLSELVKWLKEKNSEIKIIWDPVISSSSGFLLLNDLDAELLKGILSNIYLITPNILEAKLLSKDEDAQEGAKSLSQFCAVYLKGGHSAEALGTDRLFSKGEIHTIEATSSDFIPKHGSGCILSSAILCNLAKENSLEESCKKAKYYIEKILGSNNKLLAYHNV